MSRVRSYGVQTLLLQQACDILHFGTKTVQAVQLNMVALTVSFVYGGPVSA